MFGMPATAAAVPSVPAVPARGADATLLEMPRFDASIPSALGAPAPPVPGPVPEAWTAPPAANAPQASEGPSQSPVAAATPTPSAVPSVAAPAASRASTRGPGARSNRTMLGVSVPMSGAVPSVAPAAGGTPSAWTERTADVGSDESLAGLPSPARRGRGVLIALLLVGVLFSALGVAALVSRLASGNAPPLVLTVLRLPEGETLDVQIPSGVDAVRARFGDTEQAVVGGHARFPMAAGMLHAGDNPLTIELLDGSGAPTRHELVLTVEFRVRADLSTLAVSAGPPAITVVVEAIPGSTASLVGESLALDAQGRGTRAYPLAALTPDADGVITHAVPWQVQPPHGEPASGTLTTRVPPTRFELERPASIAGQEILTDQGAIEIDGAAEAGATVTLEGRVLEIRDGHFHGRVVLGTEGPRTLRVVAQTTVGHAPAERSLQVRRVPSLAAEGALFRATPGLTYARIAAAPSAVQGQRVVLEGEVYNVDTQDGHPVLQMTVQDCPVGRCPLWVSHPGVADVALRSRVRVFGVVAGEQAFQNQQGQVQRVPRVDAALVLPTNP
jgi:hypothetical protein